MMLGWEQVSHIQKKNTFYEGAHVIITCCHFGILFYALLCGHIKGVISSAIIFEAAFKQLECYSLVMKDAMLTNA